MSKNVIPSDSPSVFDQLSTLDSAAIVRPNNPPAGIAGFLFSLDLDQLLRLASHVTDYPVEDNTTIADNISRMPETITLRGIIAELVSSPPKSSPNPAQTPAPLPLFPGLFPAYPDSANLTISASLGPVSLNVPVNLGGVTNKVTSALRALPTVGGIGPFSARGVIDAVTTELDGGANLSQSVAGAVNGVINRAVNSALGGSAPSPATLISTVKSAVGNLLGPALTPDVSQSITQSVHAALVTGASSTAGPAAADASTLYGYYLNRSPIQPGETSQGVAAMFIYQAWLGRQIFSVETPWGIMKDCAIVDGSFEQAAETKGETNFSVTFKRIRKAKTLSINTGALAGRTAFQATSGDPTNNGASSQTPATPTQEQSWARTLLPQGFVDAVNGIGP